MPLGMGVLSALVFVGIIAYLINVLSWVEHSERVIGRANEVSRCRPTWKPACAATCCPATDEFLAPYLLARPRIDAELTDLAGMVDDNPGPGRAHRARPRRRRANGRRLPRR